MKNLTLLTDLYQLTMMNGYLNEGIQDDIVVFDMFFRRNPSSGGYTIVCGIEQLVDYINGIHFNPEDIKYLRELGLFTPEFLDMLENFEFTGDIYAVEEGTFMFPGEPIIRVKAPLFQAQLIETTLLNIINFQSLIATKASRVCHAAQGDPVLEFGLRRAQGPDAGIYGSRAAIIGGCNGTSNVLAGKMFDVPVAGTHAHSWIQKFDSEYDAFMAYARSYPDNAMLLVDTYDVLSSGLPNAIKVFDEITKQGHKPMGIRIDSGDLAYLSRMSRLMLSQAGYSDISITASNDLDEYRVQELKNMGCDINSWGVGTKLITSSDCPSLGGVYKLCAASDGEKLLPKIKISEDPEKITNPGFKKVVRIFTGEGQAEADLIMLEDEEIDTKKPLTIFHPVYNWKKKTFTNYSVRELLKPLFVGGKCTYKKRRVMEIRDFVKSEMETLGAHYKRISSPETYKVDLSTKLWLLKRQMLHDSKGE